MKNATAYARKLRGLFRKVKTVDPPEGIPTTPVEHMIFAFLAYDASRKQAMAAYKHLMHRMVDFNDLRVSDAGEIVVAIGERYPKAVERSLRLRESLNAIYLREHSMDLAAAIEKSSKRNARAYLDAMSGMNAFVSASTVLFALNGHAIPIDDLLWNKLRRDGIVDPEATVLEVQAFLEHQIKATEAIKAHHALRTYAETGGAASPPAASRRKLTKKTTPKPARSKAAGRKVTKKNTTRKKPTRR